MNPALLVQCCSVDALNRLALLQRLVGRITIHASKLEIEIRTPSVWSGQDAEITDSDEPVTVIEVPVELKRSGMAMKLIVRGSAAAGTRKADPRLVAMIAKAHDWFARLSSGRCESIQAIAKEEQVTSVYVMRVINLAFLAPDIVQRIMQGDHPEEVSAGRLTHITPLPDGWQDQRELLGM